MLKFRQPNPPLNIQRENGPTSKGRGVEYQNQVVCPRCRQPMESVAEIAPMGRGPGLRAFICDRCGKTDSRLTYPLMQHPLPRDNHSD